MVLRMKSGLVEGMESSNIWIDYGDILELGSDPKSIEATVEKCLDEGLIVRDGSLYRFGSSVIFNLVATF